MVSLAAFAFIPALILLAVSPARADAIDGHWCAQDGRTMIIRGPEITIPSGKRITGEYSRHAFSYVIPQGVPGAGATVTMTLMNEETVRLTRGVPPGTAGEPEPEIWQRCKPTA